MNTLPIQSGERTVEKRAVEILEYCEAFEFVDDDDCKKADQTIVECKMLMKEIDLHHKPIIALAHQTHKAATAARKKYYEPADQGSKILARKLANYQHQRRLEIAEKQRLLDEQAKADHEAECEAEAKRAEADGQKEVATALRELKTAPVEAPQVVERELMTKTKFKTDWEIVSVDKAKVESDYLIVDEAKAMRVIRANKGNIKIPGFEFKEIQTAVRKCE